MKNIEYCKRAITGWKGSIVVIGLCFILNLNSIAQAPAPTDTYVADVTSSPFNATPNDGGNETAAIQAAVNWLAANHPGGTVLVPAGTYMIDALTAINLGSNMTFRLAAGATLKAIPNNSIGYDIVKISGKTNVNVVGEGETSILWGERHQHLAPGDFAKTLPSTGGEWGYGLQVYGSSNIYIDSIMARECWGDGILVDYTSLNVNVNSVVCDDNRRQGMSITGVDGMVVTNSVFKNTSGAWPQAGIDIEPYLSTINCTNIQFTNCQFINNFSGLLVWGQFGPCSNITVTDCTSNNNQDSGIAMAYFQTGIVVTDNTLSGNRNSDGISISGNPSTGGVFSNNHITHIGALYRSDQAGIATYDKATLNTIENNDVHGNYYQAVSDNMAGNTINGNTLNAGPNDPNLSFDPSSLSFGSLAIDSISPEQTYILTGSNLLGNVTVTASSGYTISTTSGSGFVATLTIFPTSGIVSQTIYVRFKPRFARQFNGSIYNSTTGDNINNIAVTGVGTFPTGINAPVKNENVIISPNPFHTSFRIQISSELPIKNAAIKIYDLNGKEVKTVSIDQNETTISRKGMENGIYFYSIFNDNNKTADGKLVVH